jgi:hypothetical protein
MNDIGGYRDTHFLIIDRHLKSGTFQIAISMDTCDCGHEAIRVFHGKSKQHRAEWRCHVVSQVSLYVS